VPEQRGQVDGAGEQAESKDSLMKGDRAVVHEPVAGDPHGADDERSAREQRAPNEQQQWCEVPAGAEAGDVAGVKAVGPEGGIESVPEAVHAGVEWVLEYGAEAEVVGGF